MRLLAQVVDQEFLNRPDVFRREALELTFQMLRDYHPQLALLVQNLLQGIPLEESTEVTREKQALQVRISRLQVTSIIIALTRAGEGIPASSGSAAPDFARQWIVTWALIRDWEALEASNCCT